MAGTQKTEMFHSRWNSSGPITATPEIDLKLDRGMYEEENEPFTNDIEGQQAEAEEI